MNDSAPGAKPTRPVLPRDAFRTDRGGIDRAAALMPKPVVVTPDYDDRAAAGTPALLRLERQDSRAHGGDEPTVRRPPRTTPPTPNSNRNPFDAYGERSSSRPYALRLPDRIDLALRQIAAEERTHPLRIIDRILFDHLIKIGRLPPTRDA